jgi:PAS domain S-box-containing protein
MAVIPRGKPRLRRCPGRYGAKKAEEALRKSEEKYRDIFERAAEGIFQSTPEGKFLSVNPSFVHMLGYDSAEELLSGIVSIAEQMYVHPEERVHFKESLDMPGTAVLGFEHELRRKDGTIIWVSTNARSVRDGSGAILYYEGTSENITERKEAENEIRRLNEDLERRVQERTAQLEAANKELEAFSYSVSHDLRAPLRAIDGYTRIITEDYAPLLDGEGRRVCGVIQENARRMGQLIDDLLAFSRLGRTTLQSSTIDMETLADSVFHEVTSPEARERIEFHVDRLPRVAGDPTLMRQVWTNLLSNAVKFSSKQEKAVIEVGSILKDGEFTYFVRDNGAGFDMRYVEKLFGVFQRLHSEREFEGTGVGLAIVQRVIQRHGGRVWAEGEEDRGASFFFTLPAERG